jgi:hypothetical protein
MLHACDACWYCMIICSVFMVLCLWNWAGLEALGHHPSSCTCITHSQNIPSSGVAQPREQITIARRLPLLTTRYSSPISFLSLNVMRRFTTLITETPGIRALFYARLWRGCTGKALILEKTLTIRLWSIRLDCDAAQVGYVHTIKKLSIKSYGWSKVSAKYAPPNQSHASLAQNPISRFTQIVEQQPPLTSLIFYSMSFLDA